MPVSPQVGGTEVEPFLSYRARLLCRQTSFSWHLCRSLPLPSRQALAPPPQPLQLPTLIQHKNLYPGPGMVAHAFNASTREAEVSGLLSSRSARSTE